MSTYVVKSLEEAKLLTDPFKLKLLEQFSSKPVTTKQVADQLGEKAPRLYRHVDALADAGFLELVNEKPKRGTVERYYKTVASRFEVDPDLFAPGADDNDEAFEMVRSLLRETESELLKLCKAPETATLSQNESPIVMRISLQASRESIAALRLKLDEWMNEVQSLADKNATNGPAEDDVNYAGLLAFYPLVEETTDLQGDDAVKSRK